MIRNISATIAFRKSGLNGYSYNFSAIDLDLDYYNFVEIEY